MDQVCAMWVPTLNAVSYSDSDDYWLAAEYLISWYIDLDDLSAQTSEELVASLAQSVGEMANAMSGMAEASQSGDANAYAAHEFDLYESFNNYKALADSETLPNCQALI